MEQSQFFGPTLRLLVQARVVDGSGGLARLEPIEVADDADASADLLADSESALAIYARHVPHGIVPALGFRVEVDGKSVVFASDQNGSDPEFVEFAKDASLLVMHMVIPEGASQRAQQLHAEPSRIGEVADEAGADQLLLSHFMARSLADLDVDLGAVREAFDGRTIVAEDLGCYTIR